MQSSTSHLVLAPDAAIDLQMHTIYSDGTWTPESLMDYLVSEQFGLAAITDHDRVDTIASLQQLATQKRLRDLAQDIARRQGESTREVCENLQKIGISFLNEQELVALLEKPSAQQPHALVALLKTHGYGTGEPSAGKLITDAGFSWATCDIADAVDAAHRSGGVCLIAHPGRGEGYTRYDVNLLNELRRGVPIDGFEVYYPAHMPEQIAMFREYAEKHHLLTSSGSDSHGPEKKPIKYRADLSRCFLERLGIEVQ